MRSFLSINSFTGQKDRPSMSGMCQTCVRNQKYILNKYIPCILNSLIAARVGCCFIFKVNVLLFSILLLQCHEQFNCFVFLTLSLTRNEFWRSLLELIVQKEILFLFRIWLTVLFMATRSIYSFNLCMSLVYDLEKLYNRYSKKNGKSNLRIFQNYSRVQRHLIGFEIECNSSNGILRQFLRSYKESRLHVWYGFFSTLFYSKFHFFIQIIIIKNLRLSLNPAIAKT